ncbi:MULTISPECIES: siderophore ABC transporter substrate-binding protein [Microbacterium]|uniref:siderophore ABC transporter substrate-binding protein n=1 Tax=Microbacterium TaxID=33882 RepID=UPI002780D8A8|nr:MULTISPECIES: ABC transporter substrate-binding protein [Microbacterium]MDQ1085096.1 iron complex transport system substrate-binding protein [Microbacterium sp. SORGH_AS_0344]MDQ1169627.1 iron complex transport system substrate-binding protein [Microbacterium proteolyticum]
MSTRLFRPLAVASLVAALALTGCAGNTAAPAGEAAAATTVTVEDNHGSIEVPVNPERVVALDNTTFETLSEWGVKLVAAPKPLMYDLWPSLSGGDEVLDVGLHREPDIEAVVAAEPDLIVGGYRFREIYDQLKEIQPATIETSPREGEDHTSELKRQTTILGQVFGKNDEAAQLTADLDTAIADAKAAYDPSQTVMGLITSGGKIAYAAPGEGRGVGVLFPTLGLTPALDRSAEDASHGDDISVEAIAAANPEWLFVLDRDAMFGEDGYVSAKELVENAEALKNVPAVQKGQIVYLDGSFYLDEGIQAYTKLYRSAAEAFAS